MARAKPSTKALGKGRGGGTGKAMGKTAPWLTAFGWSSGMHLVGLVALPALFGWGWWHWHAPVPQGISQPLTLNWSLQGEVTDHAEVGQPEQEWDVAELDWIDPDLEFDAPGEHALQEPQPEKPKGQANFADPAQREAGIPVGSWGLPLTRPDAVQQKVEPEPEPQPELEANAEPIKEAPGEPTATTWTPKMVQAHCPPPPYAKRYQRRKWEGTVSLRLRVEPDGSVSAAEITQSSGHAALDEAAASALKNWRFQAGPPDVQAVWVPRRVHFRLP